MEGAQKAEIHLTQTFRFCTLSQCGKQLKFHKIPSRGLEVMQWTQNKTQQRDKWTDKQTPRTKQYVSLVL